MTNLEILTKATQEYWLKHQEAYENNVSGKFSDEFQLHKEVRNAGLQVVLAAEKLLKELNDQPGEHLA